MKNPKKFFEIHAESFDEGTTIDQMKRLRDVLLTFEFVRAHIRKLHNFDPENAALAELDTIVTANLAEASEHWRPCSGWGILLPW